METPHYQRRVLSFKNAFEGITAALKEEPNLKFHILAALGAILLAFFLQISARDWIFILLLIGFVISVELTNTAIEVIVDYLIKEEHLGAKLAKDISAGAVLITAITSAVVGLIIFLPYLYG